MNAFTKRATTVVAAGTLSLGLVVGGTFAVGAATAAEMPTTVAASSVTGSTLAGSLATAVAASANTAVAADETVKTVAQLRADLRAAIKLDVAARPAALAAIRTDVLAGAYGAPASQYLTKIEAAAADTSKADVPKKWRHALRHLVRADVRAHRQIAPGTSTPAPTPTAGS
ncbi:MULTISPECIES: hypothetical protein [Cryobacterium]|uniref:DUF4142 domain-containing protein n=1 Tax=Cryobacterium glucosi TaxID=1259175 RepID=A0ABY2IRL6_9MICO|nr:MULTISPECIES: hypothetical protein [Cryobacterium]TFB98791.1 hypothetical protein E3O39_04200 [Cryobacterium sp. MDB2-A-1]TFC04293.1 hypothetical protein E3O59_14935 [Cryobacterium sp. MDB2-33-2]TFC14959.1 hypothetical protein E3O35_03435 [Cryobacterium sp. MDB2-A-2]TFC16465.1 hypothetical protein E3O51_12460 [Cryobacterium sp. MDB2-10]TFC21192.1 hypothetical protein E3O46_07730 [Cryobacterium glucosi]